MSILILNRYSNDTAPYFEWLSHLNQPIVMLCDEVRKNLVDKRYKHLEFFKNWRRNGNVERRAIELHKEYKFQLIIALSESDIIRAAKLREVLHINGQDLKSAEAFRDKVIMKGYIKKTELRVPKFRKINHPNDLIEFCLLNNFPVVYKPVDGAGSQDTYVLNSWSNLHEALEDTAFRSFEVEDFIDGEMYHIDGVWHKNKMLFVSTSKYVNGCLAFHEDKYLGSYVLSNKNPMNKRLIQSTQQILEALPSEFTFPFHCEIFVTSNNEMVFCEIASRAGGARVVQTIEKLFNYNILKESLLAQCDAIKKYTSKKFTKNGLVNTAGWLLIPPHNGRLIEIPNKLPFPNVMEYRLNSKIGDFFQEADRSVDHIASVILKGENETDITSSLDKVALWINEHTKWNRDVLK
ncbi:ATP-grasp domain-containing protein [Bacillus altitudinis]|uniref:ATP-grasp domain-containing protein n=1 Tax=Bacillus altitudinis TaxID=293387 RepID=UPI003F7C202A